MSEECMKSGCKYLVINNGNDLVQEVLVEQATEKAYKLKDPYTFSHKWVTKDSFNSCYSVLEELHE